MKNSKFKHGKIFNVLLAAIEDRKNSPKRKPKQQDLLSTSVAMHSDSTHFSQLCSGALRQDNTMHRLIILARKGNVCRVLLIYIKRYIITTLIYSLSLHSNSNSRIASSKRPHSVWLILL